MREDAWLAARLGCPCFTVEDGDAAPAAAEPGFYQAKVPCGDVARVRSLEDAGFGVVDVNVTLRRDPGEPPAAPGAEVRDAEAGDRDAILEIAAEHYTVSRFHMDPAVDPAVAAAIKRDWAAAVMDGERGERMLAAHAGGRVVGFLAVVATPDTRVIDLVAVHSAARGAGAGRALVGHLLATSDLPVEAGTQIANVGALRLYQRLGFGVKETRYVLHRHVQ